MYELEDIFLDSDEYNNLGAEELFYGEYFSDNNQIFQQWVDLNNDTKNSYIYTLLRDKANLKDVNYSLNLFKAILIARYSNIENILKFTYQYNINDMYDHKLDTKYKLTIIDKIHNRLQDDNLYCKKYQTIQVNPQIHNETYYCKLIKNIFLKDKTHKEIKNSANFETIGDKLGFLLYIDDMITNKQTRLTIKNNTGIDTKQINREMNILKYYIEAYQNGKLLI